MPPALRQGGLSKFAKIVVDTTSRITSINETEGMLTKKRSFYRTWHAIAEEPRR
jgi:hypothetical protein